MSKKNLTLVGRASYEKGTEDVSAAVASISKAAPQAVLMIAVVRPAAAFVRELRKVDRAAQIFSISVINGTELFTLTGGTTAGGIGITQVVPSPNGNSLKVVQEYHAALKKYAPQVKPSYTSLEEFIGAKVLVEGMRRVKGDITGESLRLALESVNVDTGGFSVRFTPDKHIGSEYVQVTVIGSDGRILN